jgi:hypothetical protein
MSSVALEQVKKAIDELSFEERAELERWLHNWTDDEWDQQIERDARSGKLAALLREVDDEIDVGNLRETP